MCALACNMRRNNNAESALIAEIGASITENVPASRTLTAISFTRSDCMPSNCTKLCLS